MIAIGIPWQHRHVPTAFMLDLCASDLIGDSVLIMGHAGDTDANRNKIVERSLAENVEAIFFLDVDQGIPRDVRERLSKPRQPIVSALAARRNGESLLAYEKSGDKYRPIKTLSGLTPVDGIGMGCVRIDADVFRKMERPWFRNQYTDSGDMSIEHDLAFCEKARDLGFLIFVDADCHSAHWSEHKVVTDGREIERVHA